MVYATVDLWVLDISSFHLGSTSLSFKASALIVSWDSLCKKNRNAPKKTPQKPTTETNKKTPPCLKYCLSNLMLQWPHRRHRNVHPFRLLYIFIHFIIAASAGLTFQCCVHEAQKHKGRNSSCANGWPVGVLNYSHALCHRRMQCTPEVPSTPSGLLIWPISGTIYEG